MVFILRHIQNLALLGKDSLCLKWPRCLTCCLAGYDIYQIREKPLGRIDVKTILKKAENRNQIISFVRQRIGHGERVFWVFPLIEEARSQRN